VDPVERVKKLRKDYERALDAAESRRVAYHEAVLGLIDRGGPSLREFAAELGLAHEEVHQIVRAERPRRHYLLRVAGVVGGLLVLCAATVGGLRLVHAPPFVQTVQVPPMLHMRETAAIRRARAAGLRPRVVYARRDLPHALYHHVLGVSRAPGQRVEKGSTITLYVAISRSTAKHPAK
jgi:hypothetical protein